MDPTGSVRLAMRLAAFLVLLTCLSCGTSADDAFDDCTPGPNPPSPGAPNARESSDLDPPVGILTWDADAAQIAYDHATDMLMRGFTGTVNPNCWGVAERAAEVGIVHREIAQHEAVRKATALEVFEAWFRSAGARLDMLNPRFRFVGVGKRDGPGGPYWTIVLYEPGP